ncbi:MAG: DUF4296 domain-containing protein [Rikenellaceae bacterium]
MKKILNRFILTLAIVCSGCVSHTIISDNELTDIFHDAYLVNAYINIEKLPVDSLKIYEPIFNKYGYTSDDVKYTIGNFSKRKSARLGDIVERAITRLEARGKELDYEVSILDTIDATAVRRLSRVVARDSIIKLYRLKDTTKMEFTIEGIDVGSYSIEFDYLIDSLDKNVGSYCTALWFEGEALDRNNEPIKRQITTIYLTRGGIKNARRTVKADSAYKRMVIKAVNTLEKSNTPHVTIRDLEVKYTPSAEIATQELFEQMTTINIFSDELLPSQNSL